MNPPPSQSTAEASLRAERAAGLKRLVTNVERVLYGESLYPLEAYGLAPLFVTWTSTWRTIHAPRPERYAWRVDTAEQADRWAEAPDASAERAWMDASYA